MAVLTPVRNWTSEELLRRGAYKVSLPSEVGEEFAAYVENHLDALAAPGQHEVDLDALPQLCRLAGITRERLLAGDGFQLLRGLDRYVTAPEAWQLFHLCLGTALGQVHETYGKLYEVRDRGNDYVHQAVPVSMTKERTGFHTDSSKKECVPDFVGLLCERESLSGGDSMVANAVGIRRRMAEESPELLEILEQDFARDIVTPNADKSVEAVVENAFPVFGTSDRPSGVTFRYMRFWIEKGQDRVGKPLTAEQVRAFDRLDELLNDPAHHACFRLQPSDVLWVDNRGLAHDRTAYVDGGRGRLLHRMWVSV